jgi:hypothetical protein
MEALVAGVVGLLAVGVGVVVVVIGGQIGALSPEEVETVIIARRIMAGTRRLRENARGQ